MNPEEIIMSPKEATRYDSYPDPRFRILYGKTFDKVLATMFNLPPEVCTVGECVVVNGPNFSRIMSLFVHPELRGKGIGGSIMRFALDHVVTQNEVYVEADSFEVSQFQLKKPPIDDAGLRKFYMDLGFEAVPGHPFSLVLRRKEGESCT